MRVKLNTTHASRRRGVTAAMALVCITTLLGVAALSVDVGMLYNARTDLQRTSDAASLAGALVLMDQNRLKGGAYLTDVMNGSRHEVEEYVGRNPVSNVTMSVPSGDMQVGYLSNPNDANEAMDFSDPSRCNAVSVRVRRDEGVNGPIALAFAWIFGQRSSDLSASATAALMDGIEGFRSPPEGDTVGVLPLALKDTYWLNLLNNTFTSGDNYSYDPATGEVSPGSDGVYELNLYPGAGFGQVPPGNFGTVDIGASGNAASDLSRQIREGLNSDDLSYYDGGELKFGSDGTLPLNGDTGLSAAIKDDLESIIGKPRSIPIFSSVAGPGNNATFTIVGFVGIRVMTAKLTGAMSSKNVIIQPAVVIEDWAIVGPSDGSSYFVYQPVRIVR